jgi:serine-type D-Ala-D-Ala carboxypeptidase/endopeptidase
MTHKQIFALILCMFQMQILSAQMPLEKIKTHIEKQVANKMSNSIIVGIVDAKGKYMVSAGIKSAENKTLPDGNTMYELGSIGKLFTSLIMADMGLKKELDYNAPIAQYLPKSVKIPSKNGKEITALHLSTHRSGLPRMPYNMDPKDLDNPMADYSINQLYDNLANTELRGDIDSRWAYSNVGYGLLGQVLIEASGRDFETLLKQRLTAPLKMKNTVITLTPAHKKNMAAPHLQYDHQTKNWQSDGLSGAGCALSNVNDMFTFIAANIGLLKTDLSAAMELTHVKQGKKDGNDGFITMGWTIMNEENEHLLWKDGGTGGYRTFIGIDKKKQYGVIILSNSGTSPVTDLGLHLLDSTYPLANYQHKWHLLDTMSTTIKSKGVDAGIGLYQKLKAEKYPTMIFDVQQLFYLGNELRFENKINDAIKIFELNATEYPKIPTVYESLGETYNRQGDKTKALTYFEKCAELESQNPHWTWMVKKLKTEKK